MPGTLYIVATPIGNLEDMTPRAAAVLGAADFVAAEDTRVTMRLLNHLGLKKPMVSYHEHALGRGEGILRRIEAGESCALCSDAGMPCISDPGAVIVRDALARGIPVTPVPGASACVTALAVSGAGQPPAGCLRAFCPPSAGCAAGVWPRWRGRGGPSSSTRRPTGCGSPWTSWPPPLAGTAASPSAGS